jgi:hypothetical protein
MNFNALIAVLEIKGIITREEGEKLVEHFNNIIEPGTALLAAIKPEVAKVAQSEAKKVTSKVAAEAKKIEEGAAEVVADAVDEVKKVTDAAAKK